jgi:hypothetical protein
MHDGLIRLLLVGYVERNIIACQGKTLVWDQSSLYFSQYFIEFYKKMYTMFLNMHEECNLRFKIPNGT